MATEYKLWHVMVSAAAQTAGGFQAGLDPVTQWLNQTASGGWTLHSMVPLAGTSQFVAILQREAQ